MANTPGGLPYPVGTDYLVDGDNAIRQLAEALDGDVFSMWHCSATAGVIAAVANSVPWTVAKTGTDPSTVSADKTVITLGKTGIYRADMHVGIAGTNGNGVSSIMNVNGAGFADSSMYGQIGAAGVFMAVYSVFIIATAGVTTLQQTLSGAYSGAYNWSWMRLTYLRQNRTS